MPFTPQRGSQDTVVTISGSSLHTVTGVYFVSGSQRATGIILSNNSGRSITVNPPLATNFPYRSGQIQVFNRFGNDISDNWFTFIETPLISGFTPFSGFTGAAVRITGSGLRDITGLYFGENSGSFNTVFENNTWILTGIVPFFSGGLSKALNIQVFSEAGNSIGSRGFVVIEKDIFLTGIQGFPSDIQASNYLRGNSLENGLEWRTPTQVRSDINALSKQGDRGTGDYVISGGIYATGIGIDSTGLQTGTMTFVSTIYSGNYLVVNARIGGIDWRCLSYKFQ